MKHKGFNSDKEVLDFIRSKADDIDRVTVYVCKPYDGHPNVGATLHLISGDRLHLSKERAAQILNDGILSRLKMELVYQ